MRCRIIACSSEGVHSERGRLTSLSTFGRGFVSFTGNKDLIFPPAADKAAAEISAEVPSATVSKASLRLSLVYSLMFLLHAGSL